MYHLNDLQLALRIAALESLSAASKEIGMTPAAASAALQRLEKKLGCQLFARSTRRLQLTEEGRIFLDSAKPALAILETASANLAEHRGELKGEVRLALPSDIGRSQIRAWLDELMDSAPELTVQLYLGDHMADLIDQNIHLALRYGQLDSSNLKRRQVAMTPRVLVASPAYLAQHGTPSTLNELSQHAVLILNRGTEPWQKWKLSHNGAPVEIEVRGQRFCNDGAVIRDWALAGRGIAYKSWLDVAQDVTEGRLSLVLADKIAPAVPLQLVYLQTFITILFSVFIVSSLSGCLTNTLVSNKCNKTYPAGDQDCNKTDAAVYVAAAMLEGTDKGQNCNDMSGKAKQDCLAQQQALKESLEKHTHK